MVITLTSHVINVFGECAPALLASSRDETIHCLVVNRTCLAGPGLPGIIAPRASAAPCGFLSGNLYPRSSGPAEGIQLLFTQ